MDYTESKKNVSFTLIRLKCIISNDWWYYIFIKIRPPRDTINETEFAEYYGGIVADIYVKYETETHQLKDCAREY